MTSRLCSIRFYFQLLLSAFIRLLKIKSCFFLYFVYRKVQTDCRYLNKTQTSFLLYTILPHYYSLSLNVASQILYFSLVYLHKKKPTAGTSSGVITVQYLRQSHATVTRNFLKVGTWTACGIQIHNFRTKRKKKSVWHGLRHLVHSRTETEHK